MELPKAASTSPKRARPVLVIARAYPPVTGGMERFALELVENLRALAPVRALTNGRGKRWLPAFLPYAGLQAALLATTRQVRHVHLCDAMLAPLGAMLKSASDLPVSKR